MQLNFHRAFLPVLALLFAATVHAAPPDIYPAPRQADSELAAALTRASASHKRVLVDFGGNWCTDCRVLDTFFHDPVNLSLLQAHYVLVHVNVGHLDENRDIAGRYGIPLNKGVPALAVLDSDGKLVYSQRTGEFEAMRGMKKDSVTEFLEHWKN